MKQGIIEMEKGLLKEFALALRLIKNHPFLNDNKRIGILGVLIFLKLNEIPLSFINEKLIHYGIAASKYSYEDIVEWLREK